MYRAELRTDEGSNLVAVKVPNRGVDLRREASVHQRFAHPNIVSLIVEPSTPDDPLIIELCDRGTLEDLTTIRSLSPDEVSSIVSAIGRALLSMHASGWLHGDVTPSNIGLRSDGGAALLDFGSATPLNQQPPVDQTWEFSGSSPLGGRLLDIRSLAASAKYALDERHNGLHADLDALIERCDAGERRSIDQLLSVLSHCAPSEHAATPEPAPMARPPQPIGRGAGEPPRPRTRPFGPNPKQPDMAPTTETKRGLPTSLPYAVAVVLALFAVSLLFGGQEADPAPISAESLYQHIQASDTLEDHDATWSTSGVVSIQIDGSDYRFAAGQPGDRAAIADWNCNGVATLGIYRPETSAWFTFETWTPESASTVDRLAGTRSPATELVVEVNEAGCARPLLTSSS